MCWVLVDKTKVIGTAAIKNKGDGIAELKRLYLLPQYRGKGYGAMLFDKQVDWCKEKGFEKIVFDSWKRFESAVSMYKSRGFKVVDEKNEQLFFELNLK